MVTRPKNFPALASVDIPRPIGPETTAIAPSVVDQNSLAAITSCTNLQA